MNQRFSKFLFCVAATWTGGTHAYANPQDGVVSGGSATITSSGTQLSVHQNSNRAVIDWRSFDIAPNETTTFYQPSHSSVVLNRVNSADPSQILGNLNANGHVVIVNPNGVFFGAGSHVDVGSLTATSANISNQDFMAGRMNFTQPGSPTAKIINNGAITAADEGLVNLVAPGVENNGVITATLGKVNLASGDSFTLDLANDGLLQVAVADDSLTEQIVSNAGTIAANGGTVQLTAAAARGAIDSLVTNTGVIEAKSLGAHKGSVTLYAEGSHAVAGNVAADKDVKQGGSAAVNSGTIDVSGKGAGESGGTAYILADQAWLEEGSAIDASGALGGGVVKVGGDYHGEGAIPTAFLTYVAENTVIKADALESGNGGNVTLWADDSTEFYGTISAQGGALSGDGGFVEVSGKEYLNYRGFTSTLADNGETGMLLLDPANILIKKGTGDGDGDGRTNRFKSSGSSNGTVTAASSSPSTIWESEMEGIGSTTNISISASNSITIDYLNGTLSLKQTGSRSVSFIAGSGGFAMDARDTIQVNGGSLSISTTGGATIGKIITKGGDITIDVGGASSVGAIGASGSTTHTEKLTKTGSGTLSMDSASTYTGGTTISQGAIDVGNNSALGTGAVTFNGGSLQGSGTRTISNSINVAAATASFGGSSNLTLSGALSNTHGGDITIEDNNSATTTFSGNINLANKTGTFSTTGNTTVSGAITSGSLTKSGSGTLTLSGANTYTGDTTVNAGTLKLGDDNQISNSSNLVVNSDGTFDFNSHDETLASITADGNVSFGSATVTTSGAQTYNGVISGGTVGFVSTGGGDIYAYNLSNDLTGTASISTSGAVTLVDANALTLGAVTASTLSAGALSGNLTLNGKIQASGTSGNSIMLVALAGNFINSYGASALQTAGSGYWNVYSQSPLLDQRNGLAPDFKQYNTAYGGTILGAGDGFIYTVAPTVTIGLTGSAARTYDGTLAATLSAGNYSYSGLIDGDTVSLDGPDSVVYDTANAGTGKTVTATGLGIDSVSDGGIAVYGYQLASSTASGAIGRIDKAELTISANDVSRVYDGSLTASTAAVVTSGTLYHNASNGGAQDSISGGSFAFADANAGTNKTVTVGGVTVNDGNSGGNYNVTYAANTTSTINKADLTVSSGNVTRDYDGSLDAAGTAIVTSGTLYNNASNGGAQDSLSGGDFAFTDANAGTDKTVTAGNVTVNDGNGGGNYNVTYAANTHSTINKASLTISSSDVSRVYDGTTGAAGTAVVTGGTLYNNASNGGMQDSLSGGDFAFADANAGTNKTVTVGNVTVNDGNSGGNYNVTYADNMHSTIDKADLTISTSDVTRAYDGTLYAAGVAVVTSGTLYSNVSNGGAQDSISGGDFAFTDANAGANKTVQTSNVTINDGNSGGNYNVTYADNTHSSIDKAAITISTSNVTRDYDGTLDAAGSAVVTSGTLYSNASNGGAQDSISGGDFAFTDANAGTGKTVTVDNVAIDDGNGGGNYDVTYASNTDSVINKAGLTISTSDVTRAYDGTLDAAGSAVVTGGTLYANASNGGAQDAISGGTFAFTDANAGTGKTVTVAGVAVDDGNGGGNYNVTYASNTASTIDKADLTITSTDVTRDYDGTLTAAGSVVIASGTLYNNASNGGALDSISGGDFAFTNANAGTGKTVTVAGVTINDGHGGGNYNVTYLDNSTSTINKAALTIGTDDVVRGYDGTIDAAGTAIVTSGTLYSNASNGGAQDSISGGDFAFTDANAGTGKTVTVGNVTVSDGNGGGNYDVTYVNNSTSAINKADLTISTSDVSRDYDGTLDAAGTAIVTGGTLYSNGGVQDTISGGDFAFTDANAGIGKTVTVGNVAVNDGNSGGNYNVTYASNTASTIDKADLTIGTTDVARAYDGTLYAAGAAVVTSGTLYSNASNGGAQDSISGGDFAFTDANAGTGKTVTVGNVAINDGNGGNNYNVTYADNTSSTIDKADLTISTSDVVRGYDGTTDAAGTAIVTGGTLYHNASQGGALDSLSGGDFAFADANAGTGKIVTVGGVTVNDGNGGGNYNVTYASNTTSTINKADLTISTSDVVRDYDGTTGAAGTAIVASGTLYSNGGVQDTISGGDFAFADANAGTGKTVTVAGVTVNDGNSGGNYNVTYADNTSSTINKAALTISTTDVGKTYDGALYAAGTAIVTGGTLYSNASNGGAQDTISGGDFAFTDANAGVNKEVTVDNVTISDGNGGGNYDVTYVSNAHSTIDKADLTISTSDVIRDYDGTLDAAGTAIVTSGTLYSNASNGGTQDSISGGDFAFTDANAGTGKTVTVGNVSLDDGNGGGNYNVTYLSNTTSTINKAALTISTSDVVRDYNGTMAAAGTAIVTGGALYSNASNGGAQDTISGGDFTFTDANAGTNKTVQTSNVTVSDGNGGDNYAITYADNTTSTIDKADLTISTSDVSRAYDGTLNAAGTAIVTGGTLYSNASHGGVQDSISGGSFVFTDANAGMSKTVTVGGVSINDGNGGGNYNVTYAANTSSRIDKADLTISTSDVIRAYDGTTDAAGAAIVTSGTLYANASNGGAQDAISGGAFAFTDANAGTNKVVTVGGVAIDDGNDGNNYNVTYANNTASTITKAALTISTEDVVRDYDGTLAAAGTATITSGTLYSNGGTQDTISGGSFAFTDANAGANKTVTVGNVAVADGNGGNNYDVTYADNTTSTINKAALTISTSDVSRDYDGTLDAAGTAIVTSGTLYHNASNGGALDSIGGGDFAFTNANAGTGKTVTVANATVNDGNLGGNYNVTYADNTTSAIGKADITIGTSDVVRDYDGTLDAAGTATLLGGTLYHNASNGGAQDSLSGGDFAFTDANAGTGKTVTVGNVTVDDGNGGGNYNVTYANNTTSTIDKAALTISTDDVTRGYDGTTAAAGTAVVTSGTLYHNASNGGAQDSISGGDFAFADANAGTGKTVTVAGVTVDDGNSGGNYDVTYADNTTSAITKAALTISTSDVHRTYDGTLDAAGTAIVTSGVLYSNGGVQDAISGGDFAFADANAGTDKTVTVGNVTISDGNGGNNYDVTYADNTHSLIDKADLTISTGDVVRDYDGTLDAAGTAVVTSGTLYSNASNGGIQDSLSGGDFAFDNVNAGANKTVTVANVTVDDGNSGDNYNVTYADNTTSTINKAALTISTSDVTRDYDGTTAAAGTAIVTGGTLYHNAGNGGAQDSISGGDFAFDNANAGTGKTVTVDNVIVADGNGGNNYDITYADNTASTINKAALTISTSDVTRGYDGTTAAAGTAIITSGTLYSNGGVQDTISGGDFAFTDANAGTGKTVTVANVAVADGNGGNNYDVTYADNTASAITKAALTISTSDVSRAYDGTLDAAGAAVITSGTLYSNGGVQDTISGGDFAFTDANAGTNKTVTVGNVTVSDGNGGDNYDVTYADNTASTITKAALTIGTSDVIRDYDGTTAAAGTAIVTSGTLYSNGGVQDTISGGDFAFNSANAGTGKTVTVANVAVNDGNGGGNYDVTYAGNTTSAINKAALTISTSDVTRDYDGTTAAAGTAIVTGGTLYHNASNGGAQDSISGGDFAFTGVNAGSSKTVTVANVAVDDGNGGNNYEITYADNTTSTINKAALTVSSTDVMRDYDGTTSAAGSAVVVGGTLYHNADNGGALDSIGGGAFSFSDANAGAHKSVLVSGVTVADGNGGGNYNVTYVANTNSTINKAVIGVSTSDVSKVYDGSLAAPGAAVLTSGTLYANASHSNAQDTLSGGAFTFTDANAGSGKTVNVSGVTVNDGNGGNNYTIIYSANNASAITPAPLTVSSNDISKVYDGTTTAAGATAVVTGGTLYHNASNGGALDSLVGGVFAYADPSVGSNKQVTIGSVTVDDGNGGGNYNLTLADNFTSRILSAPLPPTQLPDIAKNVVSTTYGQASSSPAQDSVQINDIFYPVQSVSSIGNPDVLTTPSSLLKGGLLFDTKSWSLPEIPAPVLLPVAADDVPAQQLAAAANESVSDLAGAALDPDGAAEFGHPRIFGSWEREDNAEDCGSGSGC
jgi:filamentous hemagglutinin family protein